jgi:hypothetical protein
VQDRLGALHPRKLYAAIRACSSAQDRARTALLFACNGAGAASGLLFLAQKDGLKRAAGADSDATPELIEHVNEAWARRREPQGENSATIDTSELAAMTLAEDPHWTSPRGESFERRLLSVHRASRWVAVGIVMLRAVPARSLLAMRRAHVEALCNALIDAGDIYGAAE